MLSTSETPWGAGAEGGGVVSALLNTEVVREPTWRNEGLAQMGQGSLKNLLLEETPQVELVTVTGC